MGEMAYGQLPMTQMEPPLGLPNYFLSQQTTVPKDDFMDTFDQTHDHNKLIPSRTLAANLGLHPV
jgi:hypothetical protein